MHTQPWLSSGTFLNDFSIFKRSLCAFASKQDWLFDCFSSWMLSNVPVKDFISADGWEAKVSTARVKQLVDISQRAKATEYWSRASESSLPFATGERSACAHRPEFDSQTTVSRCQWSRLAIKCGLNKTGCLSAPPTHPLRLPWLPCHLPPRCNLSALPLSVRIS